jgi:hypothetical protein
MRQLLLLSLPPVSADALAVVVDQLVLAAGGEDAGEDADGGLLGGGVAEAVPAAGGADDWSVREPNHRVRRLPPLLGLLLSCCSVATEVLQELGAVLGLFVPCGALPEAVAAGEAAGAGAGAGVDVDGLLSLRPNFGHQLLRDGAEAVVWPWPSL